MSLVQLLLNEMIKSASLCRFCANHKTLNLGLQKNLQNTQKPLLYIHSRNFVLNADCKFIFAFDLISLYKDLVTNQFFESYSFMAICANTAEKDFQCNFFLCLWKTR